MVTPSPAAAPTLQAFRAVPRTGVVYVTKEATAQGYRTGDPEWSIGGNLVNEPVFAAKGRARSSQLCVMGTRHRGEVNG